MVSASMRWLPSITTCWIGSPLVMVCAEAAWLPAPTTPPKHNPNSSPRPTRRRNPISPDFHSRKQGFHKIDDFEINQVIPGGKQHQAQHQRQADLQSPFLDSLVQRLPANPLHGIVQEMPAI